MLREFKFPCSTASSNSKVLQLLGWQVKLCSAGLCIYRSSSASVHQGFQKMCWKGFGRRGELMEQKNMMIQHKGCKSVSEGHTADRECFVHLLLICLHEIQSSSFGGVCEPSRQAEPNGANVELSVIQLTVHLGQALHLNCCWFQSRSFALVEENLFHFSSVSTPQCVVPLFFDSSFAFVHSSPYLARALLQAHFLFLQNMSVG